jgi:hypothetical protein
MAQEEDNAATSAVIDVGEIDSASCHRSEGGGLKYLGEQ